MGSIWPWRSQNGLNGRESSPDSRGGHRGETTATDDSSSGSSPPSIVEKERARAIEIDGSDLGTIYSVAFLADGKHIVSGDEKGKIRCWRVDSGEEAWPPMNAGSPVYDIAVSQDGGRVVSGTSWGKVAVWDADSHQKETEFQAHCDTVNAVDVAVCPDETCIATGSNDRTVSIWSLKGSRVLGPLRHDHDVAAVKFSPNGEFIATATWKRGAVRVYDRRLGDQLLHELVQVNSPYNQSLAWETDSERLFALSLDGSIHCLNLSSRTTSRWHLYETGKPKCIALACNGAFIATSFDSSVSLWDPMTRQRIVPVTDQARSQAIGSMAISTRYDIVAAQHGKITIHSLLDSLPSPYRDSIDHEREIRSMMAKDQDSDRVIHFIRTQAIRLCKTMVTNLRETIQDLRNQLATSKLKANQEKDRLNEIINTLRAELVAQKAASHTDGDLKKLRNELDTSLYEAEKREASLKEVIHAHEKWHQCELLFAQEHILEASKSLLQIVDNMSENLRANRWIANWVTEFTERCVLRLKTIGDQASDHNEALEAYSTALSLGSSVANTVLETWVSMMLDHCSANDAWEAANKFKFPKIYVYRKICDLLQGHDRVSEAITCYHRMQREIKNVSTDNEQAQWDLDFRTRCIKKLEKLGDVKMDSKDYDTAIECYTKALSLNPMHASEIFCRRSEAREIMGSWEDALSDATKAIESDRSLYKGYERKHAALHGIGRYKEAFDVFQTMLSMLEASPNPDIRQLHDRYHDITLTIQRIVQETIGLIPLVLIDTVSGCLIDKARQAEEFEQLPVFHELRSSMTTEVDETRIEEEVKKFYRYVMLSHRWQPNEPTFQMLENTPISQLSPSPTNNKLRRFCDVARSFHFRWAWCDTCCINQIDKAVQQESIVAMFRWYCGSSLTVVHLFGVFSGSQVSGCLSKSIWNTRGWTYQEYIASEVVQFYTEDWKPYLGLDLFNHKESSMILSEMEHAMNLATPELSTLRPGTDKVREKLYLASGRRTTREEDIAYSLFGIFNVALPVIYGEGNQAVGRLLQYILTRSDNVTLLAWTGTSGSLHSYLPANLTVYSKIVPLHIPQLIETARMDNMVSELRSSLSDFSLATALYEKLQSLSLVSRVAGLRLPCISFSLSDPPIRLSDSLHTKTSVYHARAHILGDVKITTKDDLTGMRGLLLIHPWISPLLDPDFEHAAPRFDPTTRALRLVARLRQCFGALLLAPLDRMQYKRVATDCLTMVQIREGTGLQELARCVRTINVQ